MYNEAETIIALKNEATWWHKKWLEACGEKVGLLQEREQYARIARSEYRELGQKYSKALAEVARLERDLEDAILAVTERHNAAVKIKHETRDELAEKTARIGSLEYAVDRVSFRTKKLEEALLSIANSNCCEGCQEAALVAKAALDFDW